MAWEGAFTPAEIDRIVAYGASLPAQAASIRADDPADAKADNAIRITQTAWMARNAETHWFHDRMERLVRSLNDQTYQFALTGFSELFQYSVYHGHEGGHYDWHIDYGPHNPKPRKISLSLQLSDAEAYDGCDLEFHVGEPGATAPRARGALIAFPSFFLHRVTPITRGTRKSLVCWAAGPAFC